MNASAETPSAAEREIEIRHCESLAEYENCVSLEKQTWGEHIAVPSAIFVVAHHTGGQILGAFDGEKMIGMTLALAGTRAGKPFLHSHMTAVLPEYQNLGVGRRLKFFQRQDALKRDIRLIEWTFDPLELKNAHFNFVRLGAIARRYIPNCYGVTESPLHAGLPTDRLVAEWWLDSDRVINILAESPLPAAAAAQSISLPANLSEVRAENRASAARLQSETRDHFRKLLHQGYIATSVERRGETVDYILEPAASIAGLRLPEIHMPLIAPFQTSFGETSLRRILLLELDAAGATGWGECTAGEDPYYSYETVETAWHILRDFLWPVVKYKEFASSAEVWDLLSCVRGHNMAKAALETAIWDAEAKQKNLPLAELLGGRRDEISCGVSIGIQPDIATLLAKVEKELAAGYQRIKIKIKPGNDVEPARALREKFPRIRLMVDANSPYRLEDAPLLKQLDAFYLIMIEQPLGHDDIYSHAALQRQLDTPICLDECIHDIEHARAAIEIGACKIINMKLGRVGGHTPARRIHDLCQQKSIPVWCGGMLESGIGRAHKISMSCVQTFSLPGDVSASQRYWAEDIIEPEVKVTSRGTIWVPESPGLGYAVKRELVNQLTVRTRDWRARIH